MCIRDRCLMHAAICSKLSNAAIDGITCAGIAFTNALQISSASIPRSSASSQILCMKIFNLSVLGSHLSISQAIFFSTLVDPYLLNSLLKASIMLLNLFSL